MIGQNSTKHYLGTGMKFPIQPDPLTGRIKTSSFEKDIEEAVRIIIMTKKGERVYHPYFGCGIHDYLFGTMDTVTLKQMEKEVFEALVMWEPRIENIEVSVLTDELKDGILLIKLSYQVRVTNNPYNLIFPFYMEEGFGKNI